MKLFLLRALLFGALMVLMNTLALVFVEPHYGNECFRAKLDAYRLAPGRYDTLFIGSSKTHRHVVPELFDELLAAHGVSSFNLGSPGSFNPETYALLGQLLADPPPGLERVLLELQPLGFVDKRNLNTPRSYYWHNPRDLAFALAYVGDCGLDLHRRWTHCWTYCASILLKHLNFLDYRAVRGESAQKAATWLGKSGRGFVSLDEQALEDADSGVRLRRENLLADPKILDFKLAAARRDFGADYSSALNETHLERMRELVALAAARGVQLVFVIPPLMSDYAELLALDHALPADLVLEVASAREHPDLYRTDLIFDLGHLDERGAREFTRLLAAKFALVLERAAANSNGR